MRDVAVAVVLLGVLSVTVPDVNAQRVPGLRKVIERVVPAYPALAGRLNLRGIVRVKVSVLPNGTVKSAKALGGNPVLVQAAVEAVRKWKFAVASEESTELLELRFDQKWRNGFETASSEGRYQRQGTNGTAPMSSQNLEKILQLKQRGWRRRYERYRADFPLKVTVLRDDGYLEIQGRCGDIGHGGMGAVFTAEVSKGEVVSLEFRFSASGEPLVIRSIVRYRRGFGHGLEFLGLSADQQAAIDAFCEGLAPSA
jgi:TonB family protein